MNKLWGGLFLLAIVVAAISGRMAETGQAAIDSAVSAISLCLTLAGGFALWMGVLRIAEKSGFTKRLSKALKKPLRRLFPQLTKEDPAWEPITVNIAANMLGMGNAATPKGLEAMHRLAQKNLQKGRATDAMCMLLIINASAVQLFPATVITLRAAAGSAHPAIIVGTTLVATTVSTLVGIVSALIFRKFL